VTMAHSVGAAGVMVKTGFGRGDFEYHGAKWPRQPDAVVEDLAEAAEWILPRFEARPVR